MSAKRPRYTAGFPTGALAPGSALALYERQDSTAQQLSDLNDLVRSLQDTITLLQGNFQNLQTDVVVRTATYDKSGDSPNFVANGDFSQNALGVVATGVTHGGAGAGYGFLMQNRTFPIIDRWYHTSAWQILNPGQSVQMTATQIAYTPDGTGNPQPLQASHALHVQYTTPNHPSAAITTATSNTDMEYGCVGILHRVPDVTLFANKSYVLSFWIKSSHAWNFTCMVQRQYSEARPNNTTLDQNTGGTRAQALRPPGLEYIGVQSVHAGLAWTQVTMTLNFGPLQNYTISPGFNGLLIGIYPFYGSSYKTDNGTLYNFNPSGTDFWTLMNTGINPDFTITEVQLLEGVTPPTQFYARPDEGYLTRPYIQRISLPADELNSTSAGYQFGSIWMSNTNLDGDGKSWPMQGFQLKLPSALLRKPEMVFYMTNNQYGTVMYGPRRKETYNNTISYTSNGNGFDDVDTNPDGTLVARNADLKTAEIVGQYQGVDFRGIQVIQDQEQVVIDPNLAVLTGYRNISSTNAGYAVQFSPTFPAGITPTVFVQEIGYNASWCYDVNINSVDNTGFSFTVKNATNGVDLNSGGGVSQVCWVAFCDPNNGNQTNYRFGQSTLSYQPSGMIRPIYTNVSATYTGNNHNGGGFNATTYPTQIRRLGFNTTMSSTDTLALNVVTSPVADPQDNSNAVFPALPYTIGRTHVRSAQLQLDTSQSPYFVAMINEFDFGRPNVDDYYGVMDYAIQSLYTLAYYPSPPLL